MRGATPVRESPGTNYTDVSPISGKPHAAPERRLPGLQAISQLYLPHKPGQPTTATPTKTRTSRTYAHSLHEAVQHARGELPGAKIGVSACGTAPAELRYDS